MAEDTTPNAPRSGSTDHARGRRSRRLPIGGVLVAIDAPEIANQPWVVDAIDVNADGMGLILPPELPERTNVSLSFKLGQDTSFSRVPAIVRHRDAVNAGVRFEPWPDPERLALLEYLVRAYESETESAR